MFREVNRAIGNLTSWQMLAILFLIVGYIAGISYLGLDFDGFCRFLRQW